MIRVITDHPVAVTSPDHLVPHGTKLDNSVNLAFNRKLLALGNLPRVLDLGCAGGGMVKSFLDQGAWAIGIEGSDYSKRSKRAEWATIPHRLFTADITKPFRVEWFGVAQTFDFITLWEVIEHVAEPDLPALLSNIENNLEPDGMVIMSVSTCSDVVDGVELHQTVRPQDWWMQFFAEHGWENDNEMVIYFGADMVRGPGNAAASFHVCLTRAE